MLEVRRQFDFAVQSVVDSITCYCSNPLSDFSRNRKLPPETLIPLIIQMGSHSLNTELTTFFEGTTTEVTRSAFSQQREKLDSQAFLRILHLMSYTPSPSLYRGYHVIAMDGSDVNIPFDPSDQETLCGVKSGKPYSQLHLNALYDCLNGTFLDVRIDSPRKSGECNALKEMVKNHFYPQKSILCADRGFEKYDTFAYCIENNQKFIIRVKDIESNGILSTFDFSEETFDKDVEIILTRKQTNEVKENRDLYRYLPWSTEFQYMPKGGAQEYKLKLRVVRIEVEKGKYECLITNLGPEFTMEDLKELYHMRWNEEVGFRALKYTVGMLDFHSRKRKYIQQEIYANLILHNVASLIVQRVKIEQKDGWKYKYKPNFTTGVTNVRLFLKRKISAGKLEERIKKDLIPVRPDRSNKRNMKAQRVHPFQYRPA
ncbi:IS4 family transposase [uncultured Dubosiella sp.]|uniref:IS4 family transposase n=1 Tax=uncultured Dubosiella sp. TaxID=1937011 RepID=UPI0032B210F1